MKNLMWLLQLILKAAIFFTLFAFALNNQHEVVVHFFFGTLWPAPLVLVVLLTFVLGVVVGVVGMVPRWWRQRRVAQQAVQDTHPTVSPEQTPAPAVHDRPVAQPSRAASTEEPPHGI